MARDCGEKVQESIRLEACTKNSFQVSDVLRIVAPMVFPPQSVYSHCGWMCRIGIPGLSLEKTVNCLALRYICSGRLLRQMPQSEILSTRAAAKRQPSVTWTVVSARWIRGFFRLSAAVSRRRSSTPFLWIEAKRRRKVPVGVNRRLTA